MLTWRSGGLRKPKRWLNTDFASTKLT